MTDKIFNDFRRTKHLAVSFSVDGRYHKDWNRVLNDFKGEPLPIPLPERALDDAIFQANELGYSATLFKLERMRKDRAKIIYDHFEDCARMLIEAIEEEEGWEGWLSRLGGKCPPVELKGSDDE